MKRRLVYEWAAAALLALGVIGCGNHGKLRLMAARSPRSQGARDQYLQGVSLAEKGQTREAALDWQRALSLDAEFPPPYFALSSMSLQAGDTADAVNILYRLHRANPHAHDVLGQIAETYLQADNPELALDASEQAAREDPGSPASHAAMGMALGLAGDDSRAAAELTRAHQLLPTDPRITLELAQELGRANRIASAESLLKPSLVAKKASGRADYLMAWLLERGAVHTSAVDRAALGYLSRSLRSDPRYPPALIEMAQILIRQRRFREAAPIVVEVSRLSPADADALAELALVDQQLHLPGASADKARSRLAQRYMDLLRAARIRHLDTPSDAGNNLKLAALERQRGDLQDALYLVRQVLRVDPDNPTAVSMLDRLVVLPAPIAR